MAVEIAAKQLGLHVRRKYHFGNKTMPDWLMPFQQYHQNPTIATSLMTQHDVGIDQPTIYDLVRFNPDLDLEIFNVHSVMDQFIQPVFRDDKVPMMYDVTNRFIVRRLEIILASLGLRCYPYCGTADTLHLGEMTQNQLKDVVYLSTIATAITRFTWELLTILSGPKLIDLLQPHGFIDETKTKLKSKLM
jgi:hypothetical protein